MNASEFSQINTTISVKEQTFLTESQLTQLLHAKDDDQVYLLLQQANYAITVEMLQEPSQIEEALMKVLIEEYRFAFEEAPSSEIVDIFAIKYLYHNLKVLLKMRATEQEFGSLLIPIGKYSLKALHHIVSTFELEGSVSLLPEEVRNTWMEYLTYQDTEAIDIGMDSAYFRHLRWIDEQVACPEVTHLIDVMIDFFNVITVKRAVEQHKPNSFMYELLSRKGTRTVRDFIDLVKNNDLASWFTTLNPFVYENYFDEYIAKMKNGTINAIELERLADIFMHHLLESFKLEPFGPIPLLRYLNGKELEIKNLRLILIGRANGLSSAQIEERMRPIYGN